MFVVFLFD